MDGRNGSLAGYFQEDVEFLGSKNIKKFEEFYLLGNTPCSPLPPAFTLVSCLAYSLNLKMETCSSEMSVDFQQHTGRYFPEHRTLHNHRCEVNPTQQEISWPST
jgi:hypothetical protein